MTDNDSTTFVTINGQHYRVPMVVATTLLELAEDNAKLINSHQVLQMTIMQLRSRLDRLTNDTN
jgi:hypothetical protein